MPVSPPSCDVAVIGLGATGAATLHQLARRGVRAIGIDRFTPPHDKGSTHGETRITRQAIGEGAFYVPFALRSHALWDELEEETGERLFTHCGCLIVGSLEDDMEGARKPGFLARTRDTARQYGIAHELLGPDDIRHRFPQFAPQAHETGYYEPGGGYLDPEACVRTQIRRAEALGATLQLGTQVLAIRREGGGVRIVTNQGDLVAGLAIVSAGPWAPTLLGSPFNRVLAPSRQVMHWFAVEPSHAAAWSEGPVYVWSHGPGAADLFYGFPSLPGHGTIKTAGEQYETTTDPERVDRQVDEQESADMFAAHLAGRLNGLRPQAVKVVTCLYTVTPDSHFLIDRHPDNEHVLVASPCSGHGFKHSAAVGEALAQLATDGRSGLDLSPFALSRFAGMMG